MNVSVYPCTNSKNVVAYMSIPKNLYNKDYYYKVEDNRSYFIFNLMYKNFIIKKFIYYYSSNLYNYEIDENLNIIFYEKVNKRLEFYSNNITYSYYYQYKKIDGTIYEKYLNIRAIKDNKYIDVGYINSYGDKCIQFYKVYNFNFK